MKKLISRIASIALIATPLAALTATPAQAQQRTGRIVCHAESASAYGYGVHINGNIACDLALYECAIRTPEYQTCYVIRRYWETR